MGKLSKELGDFGENRAVKYLEEQGFRIVDRNFRSSQGEIDVIAFDGETLCFIEVKNYSFKSLTSPYSAIGKGKRSNIIHAARGYLHKFKITDRFCRFDVLSIYWGSDGGKKVELIKDAFRIS